VKRFRYPLESLMRLKRSRLEAELVKLEQIASGIARIEQRRADLDQESRAASLATATAGASEGWQLSSLHSFHRFAVEEDRRLATTRSQMLDQLDAQRKKVVEAHKQVRVLEVVKEKRLEDWKAEADREQENLVSDLVVSRWSARHGR
jgi:flagellar export protein FliJ